MKKCENIIGDILLARGVALYGFTPFSLCVPANKRLYGECAALGLRTAMMIALPYKPRTLPKDACGLSLYARVRDYHTRFKLLFDPLIRDFTEAFPGFIFRAYADHSPINEKIAAAFAGLGVIGKNTLLITEKYGSFVFLGAVLTDLNLKCEGAPSPCQNCGKCIDACPVGALSESGLCAEKCLSYLSQKRIKTAREEELTALHGVVWGCDICQNVCPLNQNAAASEDPFFTAGFIRALSAEFVNSLTEEEYAAYPFSRRKRENLLKAMAAAKSQKDRRQNH